MGLPGHALLGVYCILYWGQVRRDTAQCVRQEQGFRPLSIPAGSSVDWKDTECRESRCWCGGLGMGGEAEPGHWEEYCLALGKCRRVR